jgi:hypothetical protein
MYTPRRTSAIRYMPARIAADRANVPDATGHWATRACDERTNPATRPADPVVAALSDAGRDEHGHYLVTLGPTLSRHLLDAVEPPATE